MTTMIFMNIDLFYRLFKNMKGLLYSVWDVYVNIRTQNLNQKCYYNYYIWIPNIVKGGAKGPGLFFIIPCIDNYRCVDLRTVSFNVPPQEVMLLLKVLFHSFAKSQIYFEYRFYQKIQ